MGQRKVQEVKAADQLATRVARWHASVRAVVDPKSRALLLPDDVDVAEEVYKLEELSRLFSLCGDQELAQRIEHGVEGKAPILVTAPHGISVLRDNHNLHLVEPHTSEVARMLARDLEGQYLIWSADYQRFCDLLTTCGRKQNFNSSEMLDPRNRDPNYLTTAELADNPWHQRMLGVASYWPQDVATLHVDVHGCKNPPDNEAHLFVGLGAMQASAERLAARAPHLAADALKAIRAFGRALESELLQVMERLRTALFPRAALVLIVIPGLNDGGNGERTTKPRFAGIAAEEDDSGGAVPGRHTMTQQAVTFAGFTHSIQLEMSKILRKEVVKDPKVIKRFANALRSAWVKVKRQFPTVPDASAALHGSSDGGVAPPASAAARRRMSGEEEEWL